MTSILTSHTVAEAYKARRYVVHLLEFGGDCYVRPCPAELLFRFEMLQDEIRNTQAEGEIEEGKIVATADQKYRRFELMRTIALAVCVDGDGSRVLSDETIDMLGPDTLEAILKKTIEYLSPTSNQLEDRAKN